MYWLQGIYHTGERDMNARPEFMRPLCWLIVIVSGLSILINFARVL
jgi:hypothetical protein